MFKIGIIRESRTDDKRTPLVPKNVKSLLNKFNNTKIIVQPSETRCFSNDEYEKEENPEYKWAEKCKCNHDSHYTCNSGWCRNEAGLICDISYCCTGVNDCNENMVGLLVCTHKLCLTVLQFLFSI